MIYQRSSGETFIHAGLGSNAGKGETAGNALGKEHDVRHHPLEVLMCPPLACSANTGLHLPYGKYASADVLSAIAASDSTEDAFRILVNTYSSCSAQQTEILTLCANVGQDMQGV